jgi:transposase-like protein/Zn ribbon nucleic-acid-binding protein
MALMFEIPEDFPKTAFEFENRFGTDEACAEFLAKLRWPDGFGCPSCSSVAHWKLSSRELIECADCGHQTSLTAGTVFHGSRKPLKLWFRAMFLMVSQKLGLSAKNFQRQMGLSSYQTAWTWLHKLRRAMVRPDRPKLEGTVEVDDAYVGGVQEGCSGRGTTNPAIAVAVEVIADPEESNRKKARLGRVRMDMVEDVTEVSLTTFVDDNVSKSARIRTDGLASYDELGQVGFKHERRVVGKDPKRAAKLLPGVHRVISLVKRWLLGTHQGAVSDKHLPWYLQEYTFRFNRRLSSHPGKLFHRLAEQLMHTSPTTYRTLVDGPAVSHCAT